MFWVMYSTAGLTLLISLDEDTNTVWAFLFFCVGTVEQDRYDSTSQSTSYKCRAHSASVTESLCKIHNGIINLTLKQSVFFDSKHRYQCDFEGTQRLRDSDFTAVHLWYQSSSCLDVIWCSPFCYNQTKHKFKVQQFVLPLWNMQEHDGSNDDDGDRELKLQLLLQTCVQICSQIHLLL